MLFDGLVSIFNGLVNQRNALNNNAILNNRKLSIPQLRNLSKSGIYRRVVNLKHGHATKNGFNFDDDESQKFYESIEREFKIATKGMITYGRGVMILISRHEDLASPLTTTKNITVKGFDGDMVTAVSASFDLLDKRYMKPDFYVIREKQVHHSRVIDFTYEKPPELELPFYFYGGISEAEFIYEQLIADGVVERAVPSMLEKSASMFYKVKGFRSKVEQKKEKDIIRYFGAVENARSIYGAGIVDQEDEIQIQNQTLSNLQESDLITLRRIAMVTSIPLTIFLGETNKGLSSNNSTEKQVFNEMIESLQNTYILPPLGDFMELMGYKRPKILIGQNISPTDKAQFESTVLDNAIKLYNMSEDHEKYLNENGIINLDDKDFT